MPNTLCYMSKPSATVNGFLLFPLSLYPWLHLSPPSPPAAFSVYVALALTAQPATSYSQSYIPIMILIYTIPPLKISIFPYTIFIPSLSHTRNPFYIPILILSSTLSRKEIEHTILNNLHAGSLGCAPTPSQYFALDVSSRISLNGLPLSSPARGALGIGS